MMLETNPSRPSDLIEWAVGNSARDVMIATLGIVCTDMAGSTRMSYDLGDASFFEVRTAHKSIIDKHCQTYGGYIIHDLGDGYLIVFHSVIHALDFTLAVRTEPGHELITVHAGIAVGPVYVTPGNVFGITVNKAARLEGVALPNQICICDDSKTHLDMHRAPQHRTLTWQKTYPKLKGFPRSRAWVLTA
jgi:class 3 adenylate cyclase